MLKLILDSLEGLSEEVKKLYVEKDGKFHLGVEGAVAKQKLEEFRDNNIKLMKELEEMKQKLETFKDIDVTKYNDAMKKLEGIKDKKLLDDGRIQELLDTKTGRMKQDYETQIDALGKSNAELDKQVNGFKKRLAEITIDNTIQINVTSLSAKTAKGAMEDIIARGRRIFAMDHETNIAVARNPETGNPIFGKDATTPITIKEWVEDLPTSAPHFFEGSAGSGGVGGVGSDGERRIGMTKEEFAKLPASERLKRIHSADKK